MVSIALVLLFAYKGDFMLCSSGYIKTKNFRTENFRTKNFRTIFSQFLTKQIGILDKGKTCYNDKKCERER